MILMTLMITTPSGDWPLVGGIRILGSVLIPLSTTTTITIYLLGLGYHNDDEGRSRGGGRLQRIRSLGRSAGSHEGPRKGGRTQRCTSDSLASVSEARGIVSHHVPAAPSLARIRCCPAQGCLALESGRRRDIEKGGLTGVERTLIEYF